ncbi:MAG: tetratricopeptide repeat-containing diguanylate cyclase [Marinomonas sp.]
MTPPALYRQYLKAFLLELAPLQAIKSYTQPLLLALFLFSMNLANAQEEVLDSAIGNSSSVENIATSKEIEDNTSTALSIIAQADSEYDQKNYHKAIEEYKKAIQYLSSEDRSSKRELARAYKQIAQSYKRLKDRENTALFYKKSLETFTALDDKKNMARTLNTLAEAERYLGNHIVALDALKRSLALHEEIDDPEGEAKALMGSGIINRHIGLYEKSFDYVYQAYQYYKSVNNLSGIAKTSNELGLIYTRLKSFDQARFFYQKTIDIPEEKIDAHTLATAAREISVIALNGKDYQSAEEMAEKAFRIYMAEDDKEKASIVARVLANAYREQSKKSNAIAYYEKSLSLAYDMGDKSYQVKTLIPLAKELIGIETNKSIQLLKEALALSIEEDMRFHQLYSYNSLRKAEKSLGNYFNALKYAEQEILTAELLQKEKDDNETILMRAKLHSKKIEVELESLKESKKIDQLLIEKGKKELEIIEKEKEISNLKLEKNRYANLVLASLLTLCLGVSIYIYRRFTASKKHNKELNYLATRDPLTNCYNRRVLFDFINKYFDSTTSIREYCIILIDVDHFKRVNDTYGHSTGDKVLKNVAKVLQDSMGDDGIVSRFGGEEFCIILPSSSQEEAMSKAEKIRQKIEDEDFGDISITCSLGVTSIEFQAQTATELIDQADLALFKSKSRGRNQVTLWDTSFKE